MKRTMYMGVLPLVLGVLVLGTVACGDDDDDGPTITLSQQAMEFGSDNPVANVEVCVLGRSGDYCGTSDASGFFSLQAPADKDVAISYHRSGFWPVIVETHTPATDWTVPDNIYLVDEVTAELAFASVVTDIDDTKGHIMVTIYDAAVSEGASLVADVSFTTSPDSGGTMAFLGDNSLFDDSETATNEHGVGALVNMTPGKYTVTLSHPTLTCHAMYGIQGDQANTFKMQVQAGWTTWLVAYCN